MFSGVMKIVNTGIKIAVETTRQHMSAGGRRRSGANSEDGADVLSQHVAHQRAFAALESQVDKDDAVGKATGLTHTLTHALCARTHVHTFLCIHTPNTRAYE